MVVVVNLMTAVDEDLYQYMPSFTDRPETELTYTNDSKVNLSYLMYKNESESESSGNIYSTGDYRTLSSTMRLPEGTKLTLIDYAQEENQIKSYYYKVASSTDYDSTETTKEGIQRYIYKLSKFKDMDATSTNSQYSNDNSKYYNDQNKYAFERYDLSVDFENTNISSDMIGQQIYLQLRTSNGIIKVDNQVSEVKFNLLTNKNAIMIADISNKGTTYEAVGNTSIEFKFTADFKEQVTDDEITVMDNKYYDKKQGIAVEICDENGNRAKYPQLVGMHLEIDGMQDYYPDQFGVIRVNVAEGFSTIENKLKLEFTPNSIETGRYIVKVRYFSSDNGKYYGTGKNIENEFYINMVSNFAGIKIEQDNSNRVINSSNKADLEGKQNINFKVNLTEIIPSTNVRVVLYKRDETYRTTEDGEVKFNNVTYSLVDMKNYISNDLKKPEADGLKTQGQYEYMLISPNEYTDITDLGQVNFIENLKDNLTTGEYKLEFRLYSTNSNIETTSKTFVIIK